VRRLLIVPAVALATLVTACGGSAPAADAPAATKAPAFDTINIQVTQGGTGTAVVYDLEKGSTLMDSGSSSTRQGASKTPFSLEVSKPHGPRDIRVKVLTWPGASPVSCTIRINGQVVAADTGATTGDGVDCAYTGTP
jgi:hypothetical protein